MKKNNKLSIISAPAGLCCLLLVLGACGKKTDPEPDLSALSFQIRNVFVEKIDGKCLRVHGSMGGATRNVASVVLELQPLEESCANCPFVPQERVRVEGESIWEAPGAETFSFRYCPSSYSQEYRWRFSAQNILPGMPPQISPVETLTEGISLPPSESETVQP